MVLKARLNIFMLLLLQNFMRTDSKNDSWSARFLFDSFFGLESLDDLDIDEPAGPKLCKCGKIKVVIGKIRLGATLLIKISSIIPHQTRILIQLF